MAFPNTLFPCIPLKTDVCDEEYKLFHTIDLTLVSILTRSLGRDPVDAINVVAFVLWLERSRLSVNAVYKVVKEWPGDKMDMLADQVLGVLEWLNKPTFVSEMCCDISLIRELCKDVGGFAYLYKRRLEILREKMEIVREMCDKAFKDVEFGIGGGAVNKPQEFEIKNNGEGGSGVGGGFVHRSQEIENNAGVGIAAGPADHSQELRNNNYNGGTVIGGNSLYDPRGLVNRNHNGVGIGNASGFTHGAGELVISNGFAGQPVRDPRELSIQAQFGGRFIHNPRQLRIVNHNGVGFGSVNRNVYGHRTGVRFSGGFVNRGPILPDVAVGPRLERNLRRSPNYEVGSTSGTRSRPKHQARDPIPLQELSRLLRGINVREEETDVLYDDRTVFLTFSKGYLVTEAEVWDFFTRRFGNFIKRIYFQEVQEGVQPIFARMIAFNTSIIPLICDVNIRTKYIVNGKHVWAKKFERRNGSPPPRLSS